MTETYDGDFQSASTTDNIEEGFSAKKRLLNKESYFRNSIFGEKEQPQSDYKNIGKVLYLGLCFFMLYTAYSGAQTLVSEIYEQLGYSSLGQLGQLVLYSVYFCSALIVPGLVRTWDYKTGVFVGTLGFLAFLVSGVFTTTCSDDSTLYLCQSQTYIYAVNIVCCAINGFTGPILWLNATSYIDKCASEANKGKYMGIFIGFPFAASVTGSIIGAYVIDLFGQTAFFQVCLGFGVTASMMVLIAPNLVKTDSPYETTAEKAKKMARLAKSERMLPIIPYIFLLGLVLAFYNVFEFKIVLAATPGMSKAKQNAITATMYGLEGVVTIVTSLGAGKLADVMETKVLLTITNFAAALALVFSYLGFYMQDLSYAYLMAIFVGMAYAGGYTLSNATIAKDFEGTMEAYAIVQFVAYMATAIGCGLTILITNAPIYMSIMMCFVIISQVGVMFYKQSRKRSETI